MNRSFFVAVWESHPKDKAEFVWGLVIPDYSMPSPSWNVFLFWESEREKESLAEGMTNGMFPSRSLWGSCAEMEQKAWQKKHLSVSGQRD